MNLTIKKLIVSFAFLTITVNAQYIPTNVSTASSPVEKGLPDLPPGTKLDIKTMNPEYAWINPGEGLSGLYFITDNQGQKGHKFWLAAVYVDGESMIHSLNMTTENSGIYSGVFEIAGSGKIYLLFNSAAGSLFYSRDNKENEASAIPVISPGKSASGLSFIGSDGNNFNLKQFEGKVIVLNWLADHKVAGLDRMNSLLKKFGADSMTIFITASDNANINGTPSSNGLMNYLAATASGESLKLLGSDKPQTIIIGRDGSVKLCEPLTMGFTYDAVDSVLKVLTAR